MKALASALCLALTACGGGGGDYTSAQAVAPYVKQCPEPSKSVEVVLCKADQEKDQ